MSQIYRYPASSASVTIAAVGLNGGSIPLSSILLGAEDPSGNLQQLQASGAGELLVYAAALPLPSGAATEATLLQVDTHVVAMSAKLPATLGQKAMAASLAVAIASDQSTLPISAAALPLPTGAATSAKQDTGNTSLASIDTKTPALGQALMAASVPVAIASNQSALPISAASLPLPSGAATETTLSALNTKVPSGLTVTSTRLLTDGSGVTQPISAASLPLPTGAATETTLSAMSAKLPATLGQKAMAASMAVVVASDQSNLPSNITQLGGVAISVGQGVSGTGVQRVIPSVTATSAVTSVAASASSVSLLASNTNRSGAAVYNDSAASLYLKLGATASTSSFTVLVPPGGYYELPTTRVYTGAIDGVWSSATGNARITELS